MATLIQPTQIQVRSCGGERPAQLLSDEVLRDARGSNLFQKSRARLPLSQDVWRRGGVSLRSLGGWSQDGGYNQDCA